MTPPDCEVKAERDRLIAELKCFAAAQVGKGPRPRRAVGPPVLWISQVRLTPRLMSPFVPWQRSYGELRVPTAADFALQARIWNGEALGNDEMPSRLSHEAPLRFAGAIPPVLSNVHFA